MAHPVSQEWSRGPPGDQGVVRRPAQKAKRSLEALLVHWKALLVNQEWSGGSQGRLGVVIKPSWSTRSSLEALL